MNREQDLYPPVKALLERQGYAVKGEVGAADIVAVRDGDAPVIVELKLRFTLSPVSSGDHPAETHRSGLHRGQQTHGSNGPAGAER